MSLGFKYQFDTESKLFSFRPGYSLGYGFLPRIWFLHDSKHVTQKIQLETRMRLWNNSALMFEIVSFKTINGDDGVYDIEGGPAIMYRIGFVL